jgi:hypothetical protein
MPSEENRVLLGDMLEPHLGDGWRDFTKQHQHIAPSFYLGGDCECHGITFVEFVREGNRFKRAPEEISEKPYDLQHPHRNPYIAAKTVQKAIQDAWTRKGPFGQRYSGKLLTAVMVDGKQVFAASEGPIGYTSDMGGFNARVYPHLITAMWAE